MKGDWYALFEIYEEDETTVRKTGRPHGPFTTREDAEAHIAQFKASKSSDGKSPFSNRDLFKLLEVTGAGSRYRFWVQQGKEVE